MDPKLRANFINSVAGGEKVPCPKCDTLNDADAKFCAICGGSLVKKEEINEVPFAPVKKVEEKAAVVKEPEKAAPVVEKFEEPESVFAEGLPSWDIEPPQVMVRRKRR